MDGREDELAQRLIAGAKAFSDLLTDEEMQVWYRFSCRALTARSDLWKALYDFKGEGIKSIIKGENIRLRLKKVLTQVQLNRCCYCKRSLQNISHAKPLEHVLSRTDFPQFSVLYQNLVLACYDCNSKKGGANWTTLKSDLKFYPYNKASFEFFHPHFHDFDDHIRYFRFETNNITISAYIGISNIGKKLCSDLLDSVSRMEFLVENNPRLAEVSATLKDFGEGLESEEIPTFHDAYKVLEGAIMGSGR